jgi:hypothetical protein
MGGVESPIPIAERYIRSVSGPGPDATGRFPTAQFDPRARIRGAQEGDLDLSNVG